MTEILFVKDKYGDRLIEGDIGQSCLGLLNERLDEGYWYHNWDDGNPEHQWEDIAKEISLVGDVKAAERFLWQRRDHEYEWVEVKTTQKSPSVR